MKTAKTAWLAPLLATALSASGAPPDAPQPRPMRFVGKTVVIRYASGLAVRASYPSATELRWEALSGPSAGRRGTERIDAAEVAPDVYFISWLEAEGTSVSNVLDLRAMRVTAFVTYDAGNGRRKLFDVGRVEEERPATGRR